MASGLDLYNNGVCFVSDAVFLHPYQVPSQLPYTVSSSIRATSSTTSADGVLFSISFDLDGEGAANIAVRSSLGSSSSLFSAALVSRSTRR